jgi:hypothetical protein
MLHIYNGGSTSGTLIEFGFAGEHKVFQEVLMEGPTPGGVSRAEFLDVRAGFLAKAYDIRLEKCKADQQDQEVWLRGFAEHDETILWFEHDLFCQINLIHLLDWFSKQSRSSTRLSLICVGEFEGIKDFRGLGQLTGEQLASLFDTRHQVSDAELSVASRAWAAYCSSDPTQIEGLLDEDTTAMPFLRQALRLHLMRFPSIRNGLGRIENKAMEMIESGPIGFKSLFPRFAEAEPVYGLGDSQFWSALKRIGESRHPLLSIGGIARDGAEFKSDRYHAATFELTETGRAVLSGERDFIEMNEVDLWLGGVHLEAPLGWRWDEEQELMVRA